MSTAAQRPARSPLWPLLTSFSWQELRQHPWRNAAAVVSVMLGVALAFAVHLINASALDEFAQAVRSVSGQADLQLSAGSGARLNEAMYGRLSRHTDVAWASPVLEVNTYALSPAADDKAAPHKTALRVLGVDALQIAAIAPDLLPLPGDGADRLDVFAPDAVFLNASARSALAAEVGQSISVQHGMQWRRLRVAGTVAASGAPLVVMDVAAAQAAFGVGGQLSRVDVRLRAGVDRDALARTLQAQADWPAGAVLQPPGDALERMGNVSRAYRVNLTVLALVALFTGGFLVFSVLALSVTRRAQQFALLDVLGLQRSHRMALVLLEALVLGLLGSALGLALGTGLAVAALQVLGGDLGGGYFSGDTPPLQWSAGAALVFGALGVAAALLGAFLPARMAARLPPAQTLKGLGASMDGNSHARRGLVLLLAAAALAAMPPVAGVPLAAYVSVALLLLGGISALPWLVSLLLNAVAPWVALQPLRLLAVERARRVPHGAAIAVSGVVASLSLAVALTVMVASFRQSVTQWLDTVLPAALYVRTAGSASSSDTAFFDPRFVRDAATLPGVARLLAQRSLAVALVPDKPTVTLLVRPLRANPSAALDASASLPLVGQALPVPTGRVGIYVSEAMVDLYGARLGQDFAPLGAALQSLTRGGDVPQTFATPSATPSAPSGAVSQASPQPGAALRTRFFVAGVWRDYARQFGTVAIDSADFAQISDDRRTNDLALWLTPGADEADVSTQLRALADALGGTQASALLDFGSAGEIRQRTLQIFDRSFAVTYWLQAVAIGIGLFGVAASFSAQVLARRKEFGLLVHLGLTRTQVLRLLALEGAAWTTLGALAGTALGLAVAAVLVFVVNPQSFHWSMDLNVPWPRLLALGLAVVAAGTLTAWVSGRSAAGRDAVMAVKEDW
jgi:putative ABC transport system permease protein